MRRFWGVAGLVAALAAAPLQAACWTVQDGAAARVRDLQSMLMVATLRCQVSGYPITRDYDDFVSSNRQTIQAMNDRLKRHFAREFGAPRGQKAYDMFTTRLANAYGVPGSALDDCPTASLIARDARLMNGNVDGLLLVAEHAGLQTELPGGMCAPVVLAEAQQAPRY